jgi:hypothetical protein
MAVRRQNPIVGAIADVGFNPPGTPFSDDNPNSPNPENLANARAFALRFQRRERIHIADEIMAETVARRLVEHLERAGFVVMKWRRSARDGDPSDYRRAIDLSRAQIA